MSSVGFSQLMGEYAIGWILNMERGWIDALDYQVLIILFEIILIPDKPNISLRKNAYGLIRTELQLTEAFGI